jgi:hypothetical protein
MAKMPAAVPLAAAEVFEAGRLYFASSMAAAASKESYAFMDSLSSAVPCSFASLEAAGAPLTFLSAASRSRWCFRLFLDLEHFLAGEAPLPAELALRFLSHFSFFNFLSDFR